MTRASILKGLAAAVAVVGFLGLALAAGFFTADSGADSDASSAPDASSREAVAPPSPSGLYGRVTTYSGVTYEGPLRWAGHEEAFWNQYFNGVKSENPWAAFAPPDAPGSDRSFELFGVRVPWGESGPDFSRPFMAQFGDIARIEAYGDGVHGVIEDGVKFSPSVRVTMKNGTTIDLDRLSAGDFDDGVRVWDAQRGVVDLGPREVRSVELLPGPETGADTRATEASRLYGTVHTRHGEFTGFVRWGRHGALSHDVLEARTDDGPFYVLFDSLRSIAHHPDGLRLTLRSGREVAISEGRASSGFRVYVDMPGVGRMLVNSEAFERVDFHTAPDSEGGPVYDDFSPGRPLVGSITTRDGRRLAGRLVYDLDESETTETLDAPARGVDYTFPFGHIASIDLPGRNGGTLGLARVTLHDGTLFQLEHRGDLGGSNAGVLVFADDRERPSHVPWSEVARIDLEAPPSPTPAAR